MTTSLTFAKPQGRLHGSGGSRASGSSEVSEAAVYPELSVMGSKYLANRLIILGLLSAGTSVLTDVPLSEDMDVALRGVEALGAKIDRAGTTVTITGTGGNLNVPDSLLYLGDSGTFSRLITPVAALTSEAIKLDASAQMRGRPMEPLFRAVEHLQGTVVRENPSTSFPVTVSGPLMKRTLTLAGSVSSQFISALLLTAPYMKAYSNDSLRNHPPHTKPQRPQPFQLRLKTPLVSRAYVTLTCRLMEIFGVPVEQTEVNGLDTFTVHAQRPYQAQSYNIEGDVVAASYFWGLALIKGESLAITNYPHDSCMGEAQFITVLEKMGAQFEQVAPASPVQPPSSPSSPSLPSSASSSSTSSTPSTVASSMSSELDVSKDVSKAVSSSKDLDESPLPHLISSEKRLSEQGLRIIPPQRNLSGVTVSMKNMPDVVPTLAVLALFATSPTRLTDIDHLRHKESNRVDDLATELRKLGASIIVETNAMTIHPLDSATRERNQHRELIFDTHHDHRLAMALSLCALTCKSITLLHPESVRKSFPQYYRVLESLGFTGFITKQV